ncbi:fimbria/pilus outer membrane usher protein [Klebsiella oxytoca]|uniref:fimbria/pilus outer membrane usher protein n=1 Tax=Klebsiella oxytoca TaxID=571 RepID=UPI003879C8BE
MEQIYLYRILYISNSLASHWLNILLIRTLLAISFAYAVTADARDYFNPAALELTSDANSTLDLEQFSVDGGQLPGIYKVDIYLNGTWVEMDDVNFVEISGKLHPELTASKLAHIGVKLTAFPLLLQQPLDKPLSDLGQYIPHAASQFDFSKQRLNLSIPQAALVSEARDYIEPAQWNQGLPAVFVNYNFSGANTRYNNIPNTANSYYLNLRSGLNFGAWRLRNYLTYSDSSGHRHWNNVSTVLHRDIQMFNGQLTLGDGSTLGDVFNSVQYRGAQLASDDNMYPDSLKGFAPVVRGIAQDNAQVTVRQNGYIIYQTYVPPGAFVIRDLYPTSSSGDLEVTIIEAKGTERVFFQPFSAVPVMLREGRLKYAMTTGKYRSSDHNDQTQTFGQGTLIFGLPHDTSFYGGLLVAEHYNAQALGIGYGLGTLGALSVDVTQAKAQLIDGMNRKGQSYRFQYSKVLETTGTNFTLAGYRYSSSGYYDFQEANEMGNEGNARFKNHNKRSKKQVNINQSLRNHGNFYASANQQSYWGKDGYDRNLTVGYNLSFAGITYGINYTYNDAPGYKDNDQQFSFNMQVSLSKWLPNSWANYNSNSSKHGRTTQQVGMSGTALAGNNLSYSVQQSYDNKETGVSGNASIGFKDTYGEMQGGYNYTRNSQQMNYGLRGGIVAHPYGVTLSQSMGDTLVLVRAPRAKNVVVQNNIGVHTDWRGYAIVPFASSYRKNRIALDTETLGDEVDIDTNTQTVIPTLGALVLADFKTRVGSRVLMTLYYRDKFIPFGATASLLQNKGEMENSGIVGPDGKLYLSGVPDSGKLNVRWGHADNQQCQVVFTLPIANENSEIRELDAQCI